MAVNNLSCASHQKILVFVRRSAAWDEIELNAPFSHLSGNICIDMVCLYVKFRIDNLANSVKPQDDL
jgi:hypothetical protein